MLPSSIKVSKRAEQKLKLLAGYTGLNRNAIARIAIMLAIKEDGNLANAGVADNQGQEFNQYLLFGEHSDVYDVFINQYIQDKEIKLSIKQAIVAMIEVGLFKMGHIRNLGDVQSIC
ncbi:DndE family protein [Aliikangiella sp. IMCC44359]|uniref:DndE family protein n=1 Tax=Aliikangiella sp. IMCC44359 TaxID=3459125 RepID=UPI00403AA6A2